MNQNEYTNQYIGGSEEQEANYDSDGRAGTKYVGGAREQGVSIAEDTGGNKDGECDNMMPPSGTSSVPSDNSKQEQLTWPWKSPRLAIRAMNQFNTLLSEPADIFEDDEQNTELIKNIYELEDALDQAIIYGYRKTVVVMIRPALGIYVQCRIWN